MKLNEASLNIWLELFKTENHKKISERILFLHTLEMLNDEDKLELKTYIGLEKKFLAEARAKIDHNQQVIKKINEYRVKLQHDERLSTIFITRVKNLLAYEVLTVEKVNDIYITMMDKDMDIKGNEDLTEEFKKIQTERYDDILDDEDDEELYFTCENPDCLVCRPVTDQENDFAYQRLVVGGYLEDMNESTMMELMIRINRLEDELAQYGNIMCDLEVGFLDDEGDDDDDDDDE